jgi:hypothetical protein
LPAPHPDHIAPTSTSGHADERTSGSGTRTLNKSHDFRTVPHSGVAGGSMQCMHNGYLSSHINKVEMNMIAANPM